MSNQDSFQSFQSFLCVILYFLNFKISFVLRDRNVNKALLLFWAIPVTAVFSMIIFCIFYFCIFPYNGDEIHAFFYKQLISNGRLKFAKNWAKAEQHPGAELSLSSTTLSSKNNRRCSKKCTKYKCVCFNDAVRVMAMKMMLKMKNRYLRYDRK